MASLWDLYATQKDCFRQHLDLQVASLGRINRLTGQQGSNLVTRALREARTMKPESSKGWTSRPFRAICFPWPAAVSSLCLSLDRARAR
jgi:hypothetical protein